MSTMGISKISIILPVYNGEKFISNAINSVLFQSYKDWELLVIDDGSIDKGAEIIKGYIKTDERIKYFKNENNLGIQKTLNRGIRLAQGEYIARIDDDDVWIDKDKLKKQVEFLDKNNGHVLVGTGTIIVDENGRELLRFLNSQTDKDIRKKILSKNCFTHSSVVFRRDVAMKFGGYDETEKTRHVEDYDLWLKLGSVGKLANLPIYCVKFMMREESLSGKNKKEQFKKDIKIARKYKNDYPNYMRALFRNYLRLIVYGFFRRIPFLKIKNLILKKYKES